MANKKSVFETIKNEIFDTYGKENIIPIFCKGTIIALVYILYGISNLEPLDKALPEPPKNTRN